MAALFDRNPAFSLGLRSPELMDFMWDDKYNPNSPTRGLMGEKPKGALSTFGPGQVSLRQAQKEHGQAVEHGKMQGSMAMNQAFKKQQTELRNALKEQREKNLAADKAKRDRAAAQRKDQDWINFVEGHGGIV